MAICITTVVNGRGLDAECIQKLREAYAYMRDTAAFSEKGLAMTYDVTTTYGNDKRVDTLYQTINLKVGGSKSSYEVSQSLSIYKDSRVMVTVDQNNKEVIIVGVPDEETTQLKLGYLAQFQEIALKESRVVSCELVCLDQEQVTCQKVVLRPSELIRKKLGIEKMTLWVDDENPQVKKMIVNFGEGLPYQSISADVIQFKLTDNRAAYKGSAISKVLDSKGELLTRYGAYTLKDLR